MSKSRYFKLSNPNIVERSYSRDVHWQDAGSDPIYDKAVRVHFSALANILFTGLLPPVLGFIQGLANGQIINAYTFNFLSEIHAISLLLQDALRFVKLPTEEFHFLATIGVTDSFLPHFESSDNCNYRALLRRTYGVTSCHLSRKASVAASCRYHFAPHSRAQ
jgi:hypothetical protein